MSLNRPQSILDLMRQHWRFVAEIARFSQHAALLELADLDRIASRELAHMAAADRHALIADMQRKDLLQEFPRSRSLQLNPAVQAFVEAMLHEHPRGLFGVLKANVEGFKEATDKLNQLVAGHQFDTRVREAVMSLQQLCRSIRSQVDRDHQAILNVADEAKSADADLPLIVRYQTVLEQFDRYIDPMIEMIDAGPEGEFDRYVRAAEQALEEADAAMARAGVVLTLRRDVRNVLLMVKDLPGHTRRRMMNAMTVLGPLREQARRHSAMAASVGRLLAGIRKHGSRATLPADRMPAFARMKTGTVQLGLPFLRMLREMREYEPASVDFPDLGAPPEVLLIDSTHLQQIEAQLLATGVDEVPDLLAWLHTRFPDLGDVRTLGAYHQLLASNAWDPVAAAAAETIALDSVDVVYHPHRLVSAAPESP